MKWAYLAIFIGQKTFFFNSCHYGDDEKVNYLFYFKQSASTRERCFSFTVQPSYYTVVFAGYAT